MFRKWCSAFGRDERGVVALMFGLSLVPMVGLVGAALDYNRASNVRGTLQAAADAAALAAVREAQESVRQRVASDVFRANVSTALAGMNASFTQSSASPDPSRHRVTARANVPTYVAKIVGVNYVDVEVAATAVIPVSQGQASGGCFYALDPGTNGALRINGGSQIDAPGCVAHVHSSITHSFIINAASRFMVDRTCVRGTALLNPGYQTGVVAQGCTPDPDPLASRMPPVSSAGCTYNNLVFNPQPTPIVLSPGTYCGNTIFNGGAAQVQFQPGLYIIHGPMIFNSGSIVRGTDVTFYFANSGTFMMNGQMQMYLDAPTAGTYAGILMFQALSLPPNNFIFNNELGQRLSGAIWLPTQNIQFNSRSNGGDSDSITAVANTFILNAQARWRIAPRQVTVTSGTPAGRPRLEV